MNLEDYTPNNLQIIPKASVLDPKLIDLEFHFLLNDHRPESLPEEYIITLPQSSIDMERQGSLATIGEMVCNATGKLGVEAEKAATKLLASHLEASTLLDQSHRQLVTLAGAEVQLLQVKQAVEACHQQLDGLRNEAIKAYEDKTIGEIDLLWAEEHYINMRADQAEAAQDALLDATDDFDKSNESKKDVH